MPDNAHLKHLLRFHAMDVVFVFPLIRKAPMNAMFIEVNDVACSTLLYSREELLAMGPLHIDTSSEVGPELIEQLKRKGFLRTERELIAKDGTRIAVDMNVHLLEIEDDILCFTIARDITERKRNEEEQKLNEQRFKALYELSQMIDESEQDILDYALDEAVRMTKSSIGYIYLMSDDETELILHSWSRDVMQDCKVTKFQTVYQVKDTGLWGDAVRLRKPVITNDYPNYSKKRGQPEGHVPIQRHMNLPIFDDDHIVLLAGVGNKDDDYDTSDVVQLSLIMEGTWRIIQRKRMEKDLIKARLAAETANEVKSQFLANMSHELRTPLNGIMGMTQILLSTDISPDQEEYLSLSLAATRHLTRVLTDLLALSSIESGGIALNSANFNLRETVETLVKPLTLQAADKALIMTTTIAPDIPSEVRGDASKLRQILINLLFNAIKFTDSGEISLNVSLVGSECVSDIERCEVRFSVSDTGIGIPLEQQESIFESFTLGENYMTKQYGGSGLGLSISRQLAEMMDGRIEVESAHGKGSTFSFTMPIFLPSKDSYISTSELQAKPKNDSTLNILLAEDEQVNSIMASRLLRKAGHSVTIVGNGQQAIEALATNQFDLILMDVQMPVVNGLEATKIIRSGAAEGAPKDIPIIGLTAFARDSEKTAFIEAGMERIVSKPYEADELMWTIAQVMS
ncbi:ATP-binding protein [Pseudodesulfovibrio sp.]|nr:ATP-binding protein [Pseudodesulfovibrio sp.]